MEKVEKVGKLENIEKVKEIEKLKSNGVSLKDATAKLGVSPAFYYYHSTRQRKKTKRNKVVPVTIPSTKLVPVAAPHIKQQPTILNNQKLMMVIGSPDVLAEFAIKFSKMF